MHIVSVGARFGCLVVESLHESTRRSGSKKRIASCRCDCGNLTSVEKYNLSSGNTKRCQDCAKIARGIGRRTHGNSCTRRQQDPIGYKCYSAWQTMKRRCFQPSDKAFPNYGARGITVCERWLESYDNFLADMGLPPSLDHQIDRIDNDGPYSPNNCRWVSRVENARNKRSNHIITAFGQSKALVEWAQETGLKRETIAMRLSRGATPEEALNPKIKKPGTTKAVVCPVGRFDTITDCAKAAGMSISGAYSRIQSERWPDWRYES